MVRPMNYLELNKQISNDAKLEKASDRVIRAAKRWNRIAYESCKIEYDYLVKAVDALNKLEGK